MTAFELVAVNAAVSELTDETITFDCFVPSGNMEIKLPSSVVPDHLRVFGQPVRVSLARDCGYRAPVIEAREVEASASVSGLADLEAWVDAM